MNVHELFGVAVRSIGLACSVSALPALVQVLPPNYGAIGQVVLGLVLMTRADAVVGFCYPQQSRQA